jgi:hypothetical protein
MSPWWSYLIWLAAFAAPLWLLGAARGLHVLGEAGQIDVPRDLGGRRAVGDPLPAPDHPQVRARRPAQQPLQQEALHPVPVRRDHRPAVAQLPQIRDPGRP